MSKRSRVVFTAVAALLINAQALANDASQQLQSLFDAHWQHGLEQSPERASMFGDLRYNHLWTDLSIEAIRARHAYNLETIRALHAIDRSALTTEDRLNYDLFELTLERSISAHRFQGYLIPIDHMWGIVTQDQLADRIAFRTVHHYEDWIARLDSFDVKMDQTIALMRKGMETGMVQARCVMDRVPRQVKTQLVDDPTESRFFKPFETMPDTISAEDQTRLRQAAAQAIETSVIPAYRKLDTFITTEYLPACTEKPGVWQLPNGEAYYANRVRHHTTTDLTPDEIHEIGLAEVARIKQEMFQVMAKVGYEGDLKSFAEHLRTDPAQYFDSADELIAGYRATCKAIDPEMVKLFRSMPRMPYGVKPIPAANAPDAPMAYYQRPSADGSRAGYFYLNTHDPGSSPKYLMTALSLHEAVPGHHFQIALAMELGDLPNFRRYGGFAAYAEGWGLYCEWLGFEMGLYEDPYAHFGQLTFEMWRACRLVVDTGLHHKQWSRQRAIDFLKDNTTHPKGDITNEVDRYIAWPGQALAYKIGQIKLLELRQKAEEKLGDRFDIKAFHDVLLLSGSVPLSVVEAKVDAWIATAILSQSSSSKKIGPERYNKGGVGCLCE